MNNKIYIKGIIEAENEAASATGFRPLLFLLPHFFLFFGVSSANFEIELERQ